MTAMYLQSALFLLYNNLVFDSEFLRIDGMIGFVTHRCLQNIEATGIARS